MLFCWCVNGMIICWAFCLSFRNSNASVLSQLSDEKFVSCWQSAVKREAASMLSLIKLSLLLFLPTAPVVALLFNFSCPLPPSKNCLVPFSSTTLRIFNGFFALAHMIGVCSLTFTTRIEYIWHCTIQVGKYWLGQCPAEKALYDFRINTGKSRYRLSISSWSLFLEVNTVTLHVFLGTRYDHPDFRLLT